MEGQHDYEMVDNPSYTIRNNKTISTDSKTLEVYSTIEEAVSHINCQAYFSKRN